MVIILACVAQAPRPVVRRLPDQFLIIARGEAMHGTCEPTGLRL